MVKVRGEKVDIPTLERQLSARLGQAILVLALPDVRDGHALWWVSEAGLSAELVAQVRQELLPHQRPRGTRVKVFPRTELGKIKRMELQDELARTSD
jgi:acyl-coenzyme A synthetase/AMP-(fatty) acid ligase